MIVRSWSRPAPASLVPVEARLQTIEWDGAAATLMTLRRTDDADPASRLATLELELRRAETESRQLRAILDTATDGVAVLDGEGRILSLNRSGEALFGYDQNEVAGEPFTILLAKESHAAAADYLAGLQSSNVASLLNDGREVTGRARQGGAIPLFLALGRIGSDGEPKFCAVLRDVTQWKKAERELSNARREAERASALKSDFLAKVSHEIRTPLNAILGFAEVITEERFGPIGNERYKDYLKDIHASGKHVMSLVNDLLDLSKIEAGKLELDFAHVDANRVVSECVSLMQPQANRERVIVRLSLATPPAADRRRRTIVAADRAEPSVERDQIQRAGRPGHRFDDADRRRPGGHPHPRHRHRHVGERRDHGARTVPPARHVAQYDRHRPRPAADQGARRSQSRAFLDQEQEDGGHARRSRLPADAGARGGVSARNRPCFFLYQNIYSYIVELGDEKPLVWIASSRRDLRALPKGVRRTFGVALWAVQTGETPTAQSRFRAMAGPVCWN